MTTNQKLVVANELIGFQDDTFFKKITPIFEEIGKLLKASSANKRDVYSDLEAKLAIAIKEITNINFSFNVFESKEINASCSLVGLTPVNVHASLDGQFNDMGMRMAMYTERLATTKAVNLTGMVDMDRSKVYGDFGDIPFRGSLTTELVTSNLITDKDRAFAIIHEVGHAFNMLSALAETCVISYHTSDAFSRMMKADPKEFKLILDNTSKAVGYTNQAVVREAASQSDAASAYRVYTSLMIRDKFAVSTDASGKFNHPSIEVSADSFAIRHGGYREYLAFRARSGVSKYPEYYSLQVISRFIAVQALNYVGKYFIKKFAVASGLTGPAMGLVGYFIGKVTGTIGRYLFGSVFMNIVFNKTMKASLMSDHAAMLKRELVEKAKAKGLTPKELKFATDLLKEADDIIKATDKQDPWVIRITDKLLRAEGDRAIKDYADSQADLISNELFIKAKELEAEAKA